MTSSTTSSDGPVDFLNEDETVLIEALRAHDKAAYGFIVREYSGRLLAVIRGIVRNEEDARDCLQDAFLQAFRAIDRFEGRAKLSSWMHRIAVNAALMKLRSKKRKAEAAIDDLLPQFDGSEARIDPIWQTEPETHDSLEADERSQAVHLAISQLPENYRNVILLRDIQELSTDEAAIELGITPGAVKVRLHRARGALKKLLDPLLEDL